MNRQKYIDVWGDDNVVPFPRDQWMSSFRAPVGAYPDVDLLPVDMSAVFTSALDGSRFNLYDRINIEIGPNEVLTLRVIGAVPAATGSMLFGFDVDGGRVVLLGVGEGTLELVNSSLKALVDFLYLFACFIDEDSGVVGRPERATDLRKAFLAIDASALNNPESWWSISLSKLGAKIAG
ncbi:SUKH-4 family immunity protein [Nocardia colli]|uniref:SUKH-4 family immunity protein n=1 Tax=Nocardia colli TaxID=2545717 RepID=UPI0035D87C3E